MIALGVTVGHGLRSTIGKFHPLANGQPPPRALTDFLNNLAPDGVETWWAGTQWRDDHRGDSRFLRTFVAVADLDYHDESGLHEKAVPAEAAARLLEVATSGAFQAQLFHWTPAGARIVFVLSDWVEDRERYRNAFRGALDLVVRVLDRENLSAAIRGKDRVSGFWADPAVGDLARLLFAPRMARDNKGRQRNAEVLLLSEEPANLESLEARAPNRRRERSSAKRELSRWIARVRQAPQGERNDALNKAAFALGQLVGFGALGREEIERELEAADVREGEPEVEATRRTIRSGLEAGMAKPRAPGREVISDHNRSSRLLSEDLEGDADFGEQALSLDPRTFQKDRILVNLLGRTSTAPPAIRPLAVETVQERLASHAKWTKVGHEGDIYPVAPAFELARRIVKRDHWPHVRPLRALVIAPTILEDGRVLTTPGYDSTSGIVLDPDGDYPPLPGVTAENAREIAAVAAAALLDPFTEFPFRDPEGSPGASRAATLALLLTPTGRYAFAGPSPLFYSGSSTLGTGKSLLARAAGIIATGREPFLQKPPDKDEEMGKQLVVFLIEGTPFAIFDNAVGRFGSGEISAVTTAAEYGGRVLGASRNASGRFLTTLVVTGNNLDFTRDTRRRVIPIRLESDREDPETRTFRIPDLIGYVQERRRELYMAAVTILRAYLVAGMPNHGRASMGSFYGWDHLIRGATLWVGVGDPCGGREELREAADPELDRQRALVAAARDVFGSDNFTVRDIISKANEPGVDRGRLRDSILAFHPKADGDAKLDSKLIGYRLRGWRYRVVELYGDDGRRLGGYRLAAGKAGRDGVPWRVEEVRHA